MTVENRLLTDEVFNRIKLVLMLRNLIFSVLDCMIFVLFNLKRKNCLTPNRRFHGGDFVIHTILSQGDAVRTLLSYTAYMSA